MTIGERSAAEFLGTFWLVFGRCGSAIFAATFLTPDKYPAGIGFTGVALAFARNLGPALFAIGGWALPQLWLFWVARLSAPPSPASSTVWSLKTKRSSLSSRA
jgi:glycerol uptake facilitator-like aquaporin